MGLLAHSVIPYRHCQQGLNSPRSPNRLCLLPCLSKENPGVALKALGNTI